MPAGIFCGTGLVLACKASLAARHYVDPVGRLFEGNI